MISPNPTKPNQHTTSQKSNHRHQKTLKNNKTYSAAVPPSRAGVSASDLLALVTPAKYKNTRKDGATGKYFTTGMKLRWKCAAGETPRMRDAAAVNLVWNATSGNRNGGELSIRICRPYSPLFPALAAKIWMKASVGENSSRDSLPRQTRAYNLQNERSHPSD